MPGTMKIHAVRYNDHSLKTRDTSCYCEICISGGFCENWMDQVPPVELHEESHPLVESNAQNHTDGNVSESGVAVNLEPTVIT